MNYLKISNFKCFEEVEIPINRLTVFAGANGNGKSTTVQALLLLRNSIEENMQLWGGYYVAAEEELLGTDVPLNSGYLLALGNSSHVINHRSNKEYISIAFKFTEGEFFVSYHANNQEPQLFLRINDCSTYHAKESPVLKWEFYYLNAERIGPRVSQSIQHSNFPNAGYQGEFTAQLLDLESGFWKVAQERKFPNTGSSFLKDQTNSWLEYIIPGTRVVAITDPKTLSGQILLENYYTTSDPALATNLGFGISYVLPIIVTGLTAASGSIFVVENPEAHLHPAAQSKVGQFLAMLAKNGVNVIVETHSDHVLNGIQIAVAKKEIPNDHVSINFFSHKDGAVQPSIATISMSEKGELSEWPSGFFDQTQIDFVELFKARKG
ncbi:DUF3696 domain-containing protein [Chitinophaga sp. Hz27]|uniref:AAA family ATPase n=1 Tax=Chitinophaga sp. Hz27 TaxID=3347169 RepID=UPI0035D9E637